MQLGLRELARFGQSVTQVGLRVGVVRMQADSGAIVRNCLEELILRSKSTCQIVLRVKIVWLRPERGIQIWYGLADSPRGQERRAQGIIGGDRQSTRLNSSHGYISYAGFFLQQKKHT